MTRPEPNRSTERPWASGGSEVVDTRTRDRYEAAGFGKQIGFGTRPHC